MKRHRLLFAVLCGWLALLGVARAQNVPVYATGVLTPGHALVLQQTGTPGGSVVRDAGPALAGNFTELGITNDGLPFCIRDKSQQHIICIGAFALGGGVISYGPIGSGSPLPFSMNINGTVYPFPGAVTGLPQVANNSALQGTPTSFAAWVMRASFVASGDATPLMYYASPNPCSLNGGAGDDGSQVKSADGKCWIGVPPAEGWDVREFGAKADNATDNTTAIQNTYDAAGANNLPVVFPSGSFRLSTITLNTHNNITTRCTNNSTNAANGTKLVENNTSATMFAISNVSGIWFYGCTWTSVSQQIAGSYLSFTTTNTSGAADFWMEKGWDPIALLGGNTSATNANGTGAMYFTRGQIRDFNKTGVTIAGGQDQYFDHIVMDQGSAAFTPTACFYTEQNGGAITISNSDFLHCHVGFWANPGSGQFVNWPYIQNTFFDSSDFGALTGFGVAITPHNGGIFNGFQATNLWTSTAKIGFYAVADNISSCSVIQVTQLQALTNGEAAATFSGCSRVSIINPSISGNSTSGVGNYPGIDLLAGPASDSVYVQGGYIGGAQTYGVTQKAAIGVETGFQGRLTVDNVDLTANNAVLVQGTVTYAAGSHIKNSAGYNPLGASTVSVGASPFNYTAGLSDESLSIITGGTVTVVAAIGATQLCPASTTNCFLNLAAGQSVEITYSGGTPTVIANKN